MKEIRKDEVENLSYKDIAFLILEREKKGITTLNLFEKIVMLLELPPTTVENKIADFYTTLATDKRFVIIDGICDLRSRHTSDKIIYEETEDEEEESEIDDTHEDGDLMEDEYDDKYSDDSTVDNEFDDTDDDLKDLIILDEEDLSE